jgi:uncharacterized membrane protein HdeD (DUF308 family)
MSTLTHSLTRGQAAGRGLLAAVLGGVFMAWPGITIGTVVVLFAIYAVVDAVAVAKRAFAHGLDGGDRALLIIRAVVEFAAAGTAIAWPGVTASVMTVVIGLYAVATGGLDLAGASRLAKLGAGASGWLVAGGVLSVIAGLLLMFWPGIGALTLAIVFGAYLLAYGVTLMVSALVTPEGETVAARV